MTNFYLEMVLTKLDEFDYQHRVPRHEVPQEVIDYLNLCPGVVLSDESADPKYLTFLVDTGSVFIRTGMEFTAKDGTRYTYCNFDDPWSDSE